MEFTDGDDGFSNVPLENTLIPAPGRRFIESRVRRQVFCGGILASSQLTVIAASAVTATLTAQMPGGDVVLARQQRTINLHLIVHLGSGIPLASP